MRRILPLAALALLLAGGESAHAQYSGCNSGYGGCSAGYGGGAGYYRQSLYAGSPFKCYMFALRMYPLIHQHGPLVNYGPYEGYYPFQPYGPWTSDLKYAGPPVPSHPHFAYTANPATGWAFGHGHSHEWGHYALATFHNVGLRTHGCGNKCKTCTATANTSSDVVLTAGE